jgi:hypothetical protein
MVAVTLSKSREVMTPLNPSIINEIDAEIARLQAARKLLAGNAGAGMSKNVRGRSGKALSFSFGGNAAKPRKRHMSPEARERIRQAQLKRWAAVKKTSKAATARKSARKPAKKARSAKDQSVQSSTA